jgi:hypothetical protein
MLLDEYEFVKKKMLYICVVAHIATISIIPLLYKKWEMADHGLLE